VTLDPLRGVTPVVDPQRALDDAQTEAIAALDVVHTDDVIALARMNARLDEFERRLAALEGTSR
jgi:hypothetical protein